MSDLIRVLQNKDEEEEFKKPWTRFLTWPMRLLIYPLVCFLAFYYVEPAFVFPLGWLISICCAALVILLDLYLTSLLTKKSMENVIQTRVLIVDHVLSPKGESMLTQMQNQEKLEGRDPYLLRDDDEEIIDIEEDK